MQCSDEPPHTLRPTSAFGARLVRCRNGCANSSHSGPRATRNPPGAAPGAEGYAVRRDCCAASRTFRRHVHRGSGCLCRGGSGLVGRHQGRGVISCASGLCRAGSPRMPRAPLSGRRRSKCREWSSRLRRASLPLSSLADASQAFLLHAVCSAQCAGSSRAAALPDSRRPGACNKCRKLPPWARGGWCERATGQVLAR